MTTNRKIYKLFIYQYIMANHYRKNNGFERKIKQGLGYLLVGAAFLSPLFVNSPQYQSQQTERTACSQSENQLIKPYINRITRGNGGISVEDVKYTINNSSNEDLREMRELGF